MRAKNEFKFIAEAYNTKLILERVVDGTLMCPEACCGAPVMECKCGPDCAHCNCHEIQKLAAKEEDAEDIFPNSEYGRHLRREAERHEQEDPYTTLDATVRDFEQELDIQGDGIDTNVNELKDYIDIIKGLEVSEVQKKSALKYLSELEGPGGRAGLEDVDYNFVFGIEDNETRGGAIHKPYVSSFVSDGKKIFGVMGSDGEIVHKTRDKREAYKWFRDNYESI